MFPVTCADILYAPACVLWAYVVVGKKDVRRCDCKPKSIRTDEPADRQKGTNREVGFLLTEIYKEK